MAQLVKVEMNSPKELHDVFVAAAGLIKGIKSGQNVGEVLLSQINNLQKAVEGANLIGEELKEYPLESALSGAYLIIQALKNEPEAQSQA